MKLSLLVLVLGFLALVASVRADYPSPFLSIYVTHHQIDRRNTDYYFNPISRQVYFSPSGNWREDGLQKLDGVRKSGFTILSLEYATTGKAVYYKAHPLTFLDAATADAMSSFELFSPYVKDANAVYMMTEEAGPTFVKLSSADPESFDIEAPDDNGGIAKFAKDAKHCYYMGRVLEGVDPETFEALTPSQFDDGKYAYTLDVSVTSAKDGFASIDVSKLKKEPLPPEKAEDSDKNGQDGNAGAQGGGSETDTD